jgi:hypothetical protein
VGERGAEYIHKAFLEAQKLNIKENMLSSENMRGIGNVSVLSNIFTIDNKYRFLNSFSFWRAFLALSSIRNTETV